MVVGVYLQADGEVHPGAKSWADSSRWEPHILKQLGEGVCEGQAWALLCYDHTAPHARQIHTTSLKHTDVEWSNPHKGEPVFVVSLYMCSPCLEQIGLRSQSFRAELHHRVGAEGVSDAVLTERTQPQRQAALQLKGRNQDGLMTWVNTVRQEMSYCKLRRRLKHAAESLNWDLTLRGTTKQSPVHSKDPGRWLFGEMNTVHTAALSSDKVHWQLHERSVPDKQRHERQTTDIALYQQHVWCCSDQISFALRWILLLLGLKRDRSGNICGDSGHRKDKRTLYIIITYPFIYLLVCWSLFISCDVL